MSFDNHLTNTYIRLSVLATEVNTCVHTCHMMGHHMDNDSSPSRD